MNKYLTFAFGFFGLLLVEVCVFFLIPKANLINLIVPPKKDVLTVSNNVLATSHYYTYSTTTARIYERAKGKCGFEYFYKEDGQQFTELPAFFANTPEWSSGGSLYKKGGRSFDYNSTASSSISLVTAVYTDGCTNGVSEPLYYYKDGSTTTMPYDQNVHYIIKADSFEDAEKFIVKDSPKIANCSLENRVILTASNTQLAVDAPGYNYTLRAHFDYDDVAEFQKYYDAYVKATDEDPHKTMEYWCGKYSEDVFGSTFYEQKNIPGTLIRVGSTGQDWDLYMGASTYILIK